MANQEQTLATYLFSVQECGSHISCTSLHQVGLVEGQACKSFKVLQLSSSISFLMDHLLRREVSLLRCQIVEATLLRKVCHLKDVQDNHDKRHPYMINYMVISELFQSDRKSGCGFGKKTQSLFQNITSFYIFSLIKQNVDVNKGLVGLASGLRIVFYMQAKWIIASHYQVYYDGKSHVFFVLH